MPHSGDVLLSQCADARVQCPYLQRRRRRRHLQLLLLQLALQRVPQQRTFIRAGLHPVLINNLHLLLHLLLLETC